jgi:RNA polymerase sigma factor (sigma-70 family)
MNVKIQHRHLRVTEALKRLIDRHADKVQKILPTFTAQDLDLHVNLERLPRGNQYHTVLVMTMPQRTLRVERMENNPATSVLRAFDELLRKVKKFKSQLNRESLWKKEPVSASTETPSYKKRILENAINQNLDKIENYIRRELFHRTLTEEIPTGLLQTSALVDEVFLEVSTKALDRPEDLPLEQWMFQIARKELNTRLQDFRESRKEIHVEENANMSSQWDDEDQTFYHPDEVLSLEDLIRDEHAVSPEQLLAQEEVKDELHKAIASLPDAVRESFVLFALEGLNSDEVAMIMGKSPTEVVQNVEKARMELRKGLVSGGKQEYSL